MKRTIAVVGANGQLGQALVRQFAPAPGWQVRALTHQDVEIADRTSVAAAFDPAPDVLVNTAYWANEEPEPAFRVNATGAQHLAEACAQAGTLMVHISTDYVFSGDSDMPYRESDPTEPRSVYGISKLAGEHLVRASGAEHLIVRVSSLYGAGGSRAKGGTSFASDMMTMQSRGQQIRVVTDQIHSPTYAPDAATTLHALVEAKVRGTVHVSNQGWCSKYEFAMAIFELAGRTANLTPITLADLPPRPPRPRYTVLGHYRLRDAGLESPRHWKEGLRAYLTETGTLDQ